MNQEACVEFQRLLNDLNTNTYISHQLCWLYNAAQRGDKNTAVQVVHSYSVWHWQILPALNYLWTMWVTEGDKSQWAFVCRAHKKLSWWGSLCSLSTTKSLSALLKHFMSLTALCVCVHGKCEGGRQSIMPDIDAWFYCMVLIQRARGKDNVAVLQRPITAYSSNSLNTVQRQSEWRDNSRPWEQTELTVR